MRTTLDIDDDLIRAAKELARREKLSAGQVVSRLLREALAHGGAAGKASGVGGFRPFAAGDRVVTNDEIDVLRDTDGI